MDEMRNVCGRAADPLRLSRRKNNWRQPDRRETEETDQCEAETRIYF